MILQPKKYDPRQKMQQAAYELQYKRDNYLQNVELHHHDFYEIYFLLSGHVTYTIESKIYRVMPGDLLLISPMELHQVYIQSEMAAYERYVLWVDPKTIHRLSTPQTDLGRVLDPTTSSYSNQFRLDPNDQHQIRSLLEALYQETQTNSYGADLMRINLLTQLLVIINRMVTQEKNYLEDKAHTSELVSQVVSYINHHYSESLSLEQLAKQFYVSKYHLSHEFQRLVGTSVCRYIRKKRLMIARQLLSEGEKPNEVYSRCGFGDYVAFYKAFKSEYGVSPREYEKRCDQE